MRPVWESRDSQPSEPGWWLASDGRWYPAAALYAQGTRRRFFEADERPSAVLLVGVFATSLVASALAFGWDLSTVDAHGHPLTRSFPRSAWMFALGVVLVMMAHALAGWLRPRGWKWIGATGAVAIEVRFLWRSYSGRVDGADLAGAGAVLMFPAVALVTFLPAWLASRQSGRTEVRTG